LVNTVDIVGGLIKTVLRAIATTRPCQAEHRRPAGRRSRVMDRVVQPTLLHRRSDDPPHNGRTVSVRPERGARAMGLTEWWYALLPQLFSSPDGLPQSLPRPAPRRTDLIGRRSGLTPTARRRLDLANRTTDATGNTS
jgi:hypothetical protein